MCEKLEYHPNKEYRPNNCYGGTEVHKQVYTCISKSHFDFLKYAFDVLPSIRISQNRIYGITIVLLTVALCDDRSASAVTDRAYALTDQPVR